MPRNLSPAFIAAITSPRFRAAYFVSAAFASTTQYIWSGVGTFNWNGHDWLGVGEYGGVSTIAESSAVQANGIVLTLSGVDLANIGLALSEIRAGLPCTVWFAVFDDAGALIDASPAYSGLMDQGSIDLDPNRPTISITVENRMLDMQRSQSFRYTDQQQRTRWPSDGGFRFIQFLQDINVRWQ